MDMCGWLSSICELFTMELDGCGREREKEREKDSAVIFIRCP